MRRKAAPSARSAIPRVPMRRGELRRDVVEQRDVVAADGGAVAGDLADARLDHPEVALVDAGQHLADEARARRARDGQRGDRVPQQVDPERDAQLPRSWPIDRCHRGADLVAHLQLVGEIGLVAEEDAVHAGCLERLEVAADASRPPPSRRPRGRAAAARAGRQVEHGDDRLGTSEDAGRARPCAASSAPAARRASVIGSMRRARPRSATSTSIPERRAACRARSAGAEGSVTSVAIRLAAPTTIGVAAPTFDPSAMTITRSVRSSAARWTAASSSVSSVMPQRAEMPAAPMTAASNR